MLPTQVSTSVSTSPYLDYSAAYSQYAQAAYEQQYPYAASPAGFLGYSYTTSPSASTGPAAAATAPATVHPTLPSAAAPAYLHYAPQHHIQPDRMQWAWNDREMIIVGVEDGGEDGGVGRDGLCDL